MVLLELQTEVQMGKKKNHTQLYSTLRLKARKSKCFVLFFKSIIVELCNGGWPLTCINLLDSAS